MRFWYFPCAVLLVAIMLLQSTYANVLEKPKSMKGAIVTLIKGSKQQHFAELIKRNKSLLKYMWKDSNSLSTTESNPDIILFVEKQLSKSLRQYIQSATPELPLKFVPVQFTGFGVFEEQKQTYFNWFGGSTKNKEGVAKLVNPSCPPSPQSVNFGVGYHIMCRFWFMGFLEYVKEYDWVFRLDADCELLTKMSDNLLERSLFSNDVRNSPKQHVFVSSPSWLNLLYEDHDGVNKTRDGDVSTGMGQFVRNFASKHGLHQHFIDSWYAPYTNAVLFNIKWLRSHQSAGFDEGGKKISQQMVVRQFMKEVDESNCIYSNRWGDLPLWGAVLSLVDHPVRFLPVPYYHGSHEQTIDSTHALKNMIVFGEHQNSTLKVRVTVK